MNFVKWFLAKSAATPHEAPFGALKSAQSADDIGTFRSAKRIY